MPDDYSHAERFDAWMARRDRRGEPVEEGVILHLAAPRASDASFEHGYSRLQDLLTVSALLGRIDDVDASVGELLAVVGRTLALRTAVLVFAEDDEHHTFGWRAAEVESAELADATEHARLEMESFEHGGRPENVDSPRPPAPDYLTLPLTVRVDLVFGVLQLRTVADGPYRSDDRPSGSVLGESDLAFVNAVAGLLAAALDRHLAWERDKKKEDEQRSLAGQLRAVGDALAIFLSTGDWRTASSTLVRWALEETGSASGFFGVMVPGGRLRVLAYEGLNWHDERHAGFRQRVARALADEGGVEFPAVDNLFAAVLSSGTSLVLDRLEPEDLAARLPPDHPPLTRFLGAPVRSGEHVVGVIGVADKQSAYTRRDRRQVERLASLAGSYGRSYSRVRHQAAVDEGLFESRFLESIGRLAGAVAHEFNNMMSIVLGNLELLVDGLSDDPGPRETAGEIRDAAQRAVRLTRDLLAFARKQPLFPRQVEIGSLLESLRSALARLAGDGVALDVIVAPDCWPIRVDPAQVERVLVNLVTNASEALEGPGVITIRAENVIASADELDGHAHGAGSSQVRLVVSDTGRGMDDATRRRIFDPFFTSKRFGQNAGMGLPTAQGIVTQSGGWIRVESTPGKGTDVNVYFPRDPTPAVPLRIEPAQGEPRMVATVLIVDDEPAIVRLAASILRREGHTVLEATSGRDAVNAALGRAGRVDVLISDIMMPTMSGVDVASALRDARPDIAVLFLSGYPADQLLTAIPGAPAAFLAKPFAPSDLVRVVDGVLGRCARAS